MARAPWLESDEEFEGVGAHELNPRYDPVDEAEGILRRAVHKRLARTPALDAARAVNVNSYVRRLDGHDGSHWQPDAGPVDMDLLRLNTFWWAWKATQSTSYVDPTFKGMRLEAKRVKFVHRLYYHWLSSTTDPVAQAQHYLRTIGPWSPGEGAMLDAEEGGITVEKCLAWLEIVEESTKRPCSVYSGIYVAGGTIWKDPRIRMSKYGPRPMHLAAYVTITRLLSLLTSRGIADLAINAWQYSSDGPVPGITGRADMNTIITREAYDLACGIISVVTQPPDPEDEVADIATNKEEFFGAAPGDFKYWVREKQDGNITLYHLDPDEWAALGAKYGAPISNATIGRLGIVANHAWPAETVGVGTDCKFGKMAVNIEGIGTAIPTGGQ